MDRAEELLIGSGKSMTHDEIRQLLQNEGVSEPVVDYVMSGGVVPTLKKVKSGMTISWELE
ncbi:MAG TPA: hypothetical protein VFS00_24200 [Polyangiaceae bacterium]|nr:hypothetical protein [Polyangiaceae bacterium]